MDNDEVHVAGDFFLNPLIPDGTRRKTFYDRVQRFIPAETIVYMQFCLLRIPFVLIYDYLFTDQFSTVIERFFQYSTGVFDRHNRFLLKLFSYLFHSSIFQWVLHLNLSLCVPLLGLVPIVFFLLSSDRHLVIFYSYTISLLVIYFDYQMTSIVDNPLTSSLNMYILQFLLSSVYIQMLNIRPRVSSYKVQTYLCHFAPFALLITRYLMPSTMSVNLLRAYYLLWTSVHLSEFFLFHYETVISLIRDRFFNSLYHIYRNLGFQTLLEYIQTQTNLFTLLKIFWLTKILILPLGIRSLQTTPHIFNVTHQEIVDVDRIDSPANFTETIYFTCLFYGTETTFTLISLACLVSHVMKNISHRLFRILNLWNDDVEQIGTLVGVMFFLLLFQSNVTQLNLDRRHVPLFKAFSLLIIALFHFLHTILEPQLLKVAMQTMTTRMAFDHTDENHQEDDEDQNKSILHSFRHEHVYTCLVILFLVVFYMILLWHLTSFSTWLLAVTAFSLELIVRLVASLAQYTVYVLDAHNRLATVDSFDDYIFRIKAVTSCFEFLLGVFLLFNGVYIFFFESRGALRALMLGIHAYANIIKNLRRGWQIFHNRQSAWSNVNQLPLATDKQIEEYNDICPICHHPLRSGVTCVTPCSHLFHQKCLQKAFYTTSNCALCSRSIVAEKKTHQD